MGREAQRGCENEAGSRPGATTRRLTHVTFYRVCQCHHIAVIRDDTGRMSPAENTGCSSRSTGRALNTASQTDTGCSCPKAFGSLLASQDEDIAELKSCNFGCFSQKRSVRRGTFSRDILRVRGNPQRRQDADLSKERPYVPDDYLHVCHRLPERVIVRR